MSSECSNKKDVLEEIKKYARLTILAITRYVGDIYYEFPINTSMDAVEQVELESFLESSKFIEYLIAQIQIRLCFLKAQKVHYTLSECKEITYFLKTIQYVSGLVVLMDGTAIVDYSKIGNDDMDQVKELDDKVYLIQNYIKTHFACYSDLKYALYIQQMQTIFNQIMNMSITSFLLANDTCLVFNGQDWTAQAIVTSQKMQKNILFMLHYLNTVHSLNNITPSIKECIDFEQVFHDEVKFLINDINKLSMGEVKAKDVQERFFEYVDYLKMSKKQEIELIQQY